MADWQTFPYVAAPSPDDRSKSVHYKVCGEYCTINGAISRKTPILQLWTHVVGTFPPINNIARLQRGAVQPTISTLMDSIACFKGVKRPYDEEAEGDSIIVYVLNPEASIVYDPSMVCLAKAVKMPALSTLTVQVRPMDCLQVGEIDVIGEVTRIEPVFADSDDPSLPKDYRNRYGKLMWRA